jgi:NAD+ synthetase
MLSLQLQNILAELRDQRGFDAEACLQAKADLINSYFRDNGLNAAVFGLSGGVDSAVVAAILHHAHCQPGSPIRRVVALIVPICAIGSSGQAAATDRAKEVAAALNIESWVCDMSTPQIMARQALQDGADLRMSQWTCGQMLSVMRTPVFYGAAALLQQEGYRSLVVGTTNRDEGAYIGFFGKASDGMVDLQVLSDLHKSEVYDLAWLLRIPRFVINEKPRGDVWDGRTDEEMIGAPYDFLELYQLMKCLPLDQSLHIVSCLDGPGLDEFISWASAIEALHNVNAHKYRVGSPAIHLDVYERSVPGGW